MPSDIPDLDELSRLIASLRVDSRPDGWRYMPHEPFEKQRRFLELDVLEAFYGGAAAGGKSDALLMGALQQMHHKKYAALIIRRTFKDLNMPGAIMDRAHTWLEPFRNSKEIHWDEEQHRYTFRKSGATLTFGYLDTERDRRRYLGAEIQYLGFDELTQIQELWYRYLCARVRRPKGITGPLKIRGASNPGEIGHEWVKKRFVDVPEDRVFIPSTAKDNPFIDYDEYVNSLDILDELTRRQMDGEWVADGAGLVYHFDLVDLIQEAPKCDFHIVAEDYGYTDDTSYSVLGWRKNDPHVYALESYRKSKQTPQLAAEETYRLNQKYAPVEIVGDTGGLGKGYAEHIQERFGIPIQAAEKNNKIGYIKLLNGELEKHRIKVVESTCGDLLDEWSTLSWKKGRREEDPTFNNHCSDGVLYGWRRTFAHHERVPPPPKDAMQILQAEEERMVKQLEEQVKNADTEISSLL